MENGGREQLKNFSEVPNETWGLLCAGQLSMLVPMGASAARSTATCSSSSVAGTSAAMAGAAWNACRVRCSGVSLQLDSIPAEEESAPQDSETRFRRAPYNHTTKVDDEAQSSLPNVSEEWSRSAYRGAEAVAGRVSLIVSSVKRAAGETAPRHFVTHTKDAASRICWQAVKIVKKSGDQVSRGDITMAWLWRWKQ
jgi:hypothetical protein